MIPFEKPAIHKVFRTFRNFPGSKISRPNHQKEVFRGCLEFIPQCAGENAGAIIDRSYRNIGGDPFFDKRKRVRFATHPFSLITA